MKVIWHTTACGNCGICLKFAKNPLFLLLLVYYHWDALVTILNNQGERQA